jgi:hypothetical protein
MFSLGDLVWVASVRWAQKQIRCPDCFGKRFLRVILGDDSQVTVECPECCRGYEGPQGVVGTYDYIASVEPEIVSGLEKDWRDEREVIVYRFNHHSGVVETDCFATKEEAEQRASVLAKEQAEQEAKRLASKEKPNKSWAWNATYHRGEIRRAERDLIYHRSKLEVALAHKKEESVATAA